MRKDQKKIVILAGPNGAGKTTLAREFLPKDANCPRFINADLIAYGLSPFNPELAMIRAGRLMVEQMTSFVRKRESFAFESTLSGLRYARLIPQWQKKGYLVKLIFLRIDHPQLAIARVVARVAHGGHNVPEEVIRRRFRAGSRHFDQTYKTLVDRWILYENSQERPIWVEEGQNTR
ncbi:MAG: hypothetical protein NPIRA02_11080 [Nitrospirales bacterium]|nr:MAG: hypothetical protein NPIRA02_11080 [Nitrospirales bacterium]